MSVIRSLIDAERYVDTILHRVDKLERLNSNNDFASKGDVVRIIERVERTSGVDINTLQNDLDSVVGNEEVFHNLNHRFQSFVFIHDSIFISTLNIGTPPGFSNFFYWNYNAGTGNLELFDSSTNKIASIVGGARPQNWNFDAHLIPIVNNSADLGSAANRWRKLWVVDANFSGAITAPSGSAGVTSTMTVGTSISVGTTTLSYTAGLSTLEVVTSVTLNTTGFNFSGGLRTS